jgi:hypothetical protein
MLVSYRRKASTTAPRTQKTSRPAKPATPHAAPAPHVEVAIPTPAPLVDRVPAVATESAHLPAAPPTPTAEVATPLNAVAPIMVAGAATAIGQEVKLDDDAYHSTIPTPSSTSGSSYGSSHTTEEDLCPHFAKGLEEGKIILETCTPDQLNYLQYQTQWHIDYFTQWIAIPGCAISLRFWQGRLAGLDPEKKRQGDWAAYKQGLADGTNSFNTGIGHDAKEIARILAEHENKPHAPGDTEHHRHWLYLKGYHQQLLEKQSRATAASES